MQIIEHKRITQLCILDGLLQGETLRVERDQAIADGPILYGLTQYHILGERNQFDELEFSQTRQYLLHGLRLRLLGHRTDADNHLLAVAGRGACVRVHPVIAVAEVGVALMKQNLENETKEKIWKISEFCIICDCCCFALESRSYSASKTTINKIKINQKKRGEKQFKFFYKLILLDKFYLSNV